MSSTASSATRTVLGGGGPAIPNGTALHSFAMGGDGGAAGRGGKPPLPHIDDLTSASPDVDMKLPLRKILEKGDNAMRQAETFRDFGRPDLAFKEYIKASLIAIRYVPQHPDFLAIKAGQGDMSRIYQALMKKISSQHDNFEKIKADIIADNRKTGVRPTVSRPSSIINGVASRPPVSNGEADRPRTPLGQPGQPVVSPTRAEAGTQVNGSPGTKAKPAVQPKPQALLGNVIRPGANGAKSKAAEDLAARFANLRGPVALPGQDPRIRTHPIVPPKPAGPREMPPPQATEKPKVAVVTSLPDLPKMPDAIYSPARGTVSNEAASLPSSTPRGLFSRTGSSATINTVLANNKSPDYFSPFHPAPNNVPVPVKAPSIAIPEGDSITAEDLMSYIRRGSAALQVLIIDVRSREDYDEGHILSQAVICVEPNILLRENISSDQIAESMVLSPGQEYHHFERRDAFDLVVFHDQDSDSIPRYMSPDMDAAALLSLQRALTYFNYGKELKNPPKLLQGGLDAWTDLVGRSALATSQTAGAARVPVPRVRSPLKPTISISKPNRKYKVTPLKPEEVKQWEETLHIADLETARSPGFMHVRSTEEFLRRFPAVSTEQESMQSPVSPDRPPLPPHSYGQSHVDIYSELPSPPTRPAPAVPRPSYSGLSQTQDDHEAPQAIAFPAQARNLKQGPLARPDSPSVMSAVKDGHHITGLNNPGVWCYANSSIQALRMSPGFGKELATFEWQNTYKVPKKPDEKNDHPQLMSRILSNLFHWLDSGKFDVMKAQTLMDYSRSVCEKSRIKDKGDEFGGNRQQDAQEFMSWLMAYLHEETNMRRDRGGDDNSTVPVMKGGKSMLQGAYEWWGHYSRTNLSIVDKYWRGLELSTVVCSRCHNRTYNWATFDFISVPINGGTRSIEDCLRSYIEPETLPDYRCDNCNMAVEGRKQIALARLPELLCLSFRRFDYDSTLQLHKKRDMITWDFNNLNLDPFFIPPEERNTVGPPLDEKFELPFDYECYAVIIHTGNNITSGHYYAYVREPQNPDPHAWYRISDSRVTPVRIDGTGRGSDASRDVFKKSTSDVPYLVFFRRKQGRTRR